jgi:predicted Zn-dependent protease
VLFEAQGMMEAGDYEAAASELRRSRESGEQHPETALLLGLCEYELGNVEAAIEVLEEVFEAETWISVGRQGGLYGVLTAKAAEAHSENVRMGVARLVQLQVEAGRPRDAQATFARAQAQLGPSGELAAAQISLLVAQGQPTDAATLAVSSLEQWPGSSLLLSTATWLATTNPEARTPELDLALASTGEWRSIFNGAVERYNAGDHDGCLQHVEQAPSFADPAVVLDFAQLAYSCATSGGDLSAADRWLEPAGGAVGVQAIPRFNHAVLLDRAGQDQAALALLDAADPPADQPALCEDHRSLVVDIHVRRGDLEVALAALELGPVDPLGRFNVGILLVNAQRVDDALPLLRATCPEIPVASEQVRCQELLERLEAN